MGQIRSKSILTDTIRQVSQIFATSYDGGATGDTDLIIQAGALSVAGSVRFKGGFLDDPLSSGGALSVHDALTVGIFSSAPGLDSEAILTGVKIAPLNDGLSVGQDFVLKTATSDGHLVYAPANKFGSLFVDNTLHVNTLSIGDEIAAASASFGTLSAGSLVGITLETQDLIVSNNLSIGGALDFASAVVAEDLSVGGTITAEGALAVEGTLAAAGDVSVAGSVHVDGHITTSTVTADSFVGSLSSGAAHIQSAFLHDLTVTGTVSGLSVQASIPDDFSFTSLSVAELSVGVAFADFADVQQLSVQAAQISDAAIHDLHITGSLTGVSLAGSFEVPDDLSVQTVFASTSVTTNQFIGTGLAPFPGSQSQVVVDDVRSTDATINDLTVTNHLVAANILQSDEQFIANAFSAATGVVAVLSVGTLFAEFIGGLSVSATFDAEIPLDELSVGTLFGNSAFLAGEVSANTMTTSILSVGQFHADNLDLSFALDDDLSVSTLFATGSVTASDGIFTTLNAGDFLATNAGAQTLSVGSASVQDLEAGTFSVESLTFTNGRAFNMLVDNNLTVQGNVTAISTEQMLIEDHRIELGVTSSFRAATLFQAVRTLRSTASGLFVKTEFGFGFESGQTVVPDDFFVTHMTSQPYQGSQPPITPSILHVKRLLLQSTNQLPNVLSTGSVLSTGPPYPLSAGGLMAGTGLNLNELDWVTAVVSQTGTAIAGKYQAPFHVPGGPVNGTGALEIWSTNLFRPSVLRADYKFASATKAVRVQSITRVNSVGTSATSKDLYDDSLPGNFLYLVELTEAEPIEAVDSENDVEVGLKMWRDDTAIGGGFAIKGYSDKTWQYVRSSPFTPVGYVGHLSTGAGLLAPQQLSSFLTSEDISLGKKVHAHDQLSVGSSFLDTSPRSNAIHLGDMFQRHWIICAAWDPSYASTGLYADEDDAPKLQFYFGSDVRDDVSMDAQELHGCRLAFEITAPTSAPNGLENLYPSATPIGYNTYQGAVVV